MTKLNWLAIIDRVLLSIGVALVGFCFFFALVVLAPEPEILCIGEATGYVAAPCDRDGILR